MTHISKLTKAELLEEHNALKRAADSAALTAQALQEKIFAATKLVTVPEAEALAGCIRALDALNSTIRRDNNGMTFYGSYSSNPHADEVGRILRSLADRYQVRLVDSLPCDRTHLDQVDPAIVSDALRRAVSS